MRLNIIYNYLFTIMSNNNELYKIKQMSFRELKNELSKCNDNPIKGLIIRKLMKEKAIKYKKRKKDIRQKMINEKNKQNKLPNIIHN